MRETGQQLARLEIRVSSEEPRQPALLVHVPLGLSIRAGIKFQVDDAEPLMLDIQTCDASGCYAGNPIGPELLASLKKGNSVKVIFQNLQQNEISVGFSLAGFTANYSKIE